MNSEFWEGPGVTGILTIHFNPKKILKLYTSFLTLETGEWCDENAGIQQAEVGVKTITYVVYTWKSAT